MNLATDEAQEGVIPTPKIQNFYDMAKSFFNFNILLTFG
jgi:hypothetical protein